MRHVRGILTALSENYEIAYLRSVKNLLQHPLKFFLLVKHNFLLNFYYKFSRKRMWIGISILLPHWFHKVLSLRNSVTRFWLPCRGSFKDTSNFENLCHDKKIGIPILLSHRFHKVLSLRNYVARFWLLHKGSFMDTSKF